MTRNSERLLSGANAEVVSLKKDKSYLEQSVTDLRKQIDSTDKEARLATNEVQKAQFREEALKSQVTLAQERFQEARDEIFLLRQDKEKLFNKVDHLLYENENLRSEIFMMKKIMIEIEKRDMHLSSVGNFRDSKVSEEAVRDRGRVFDAELDEIRNRPDASR